jgi:hypothetical protein
LFAVISYQQQARINTYEGRCASSGIAPDHRRCNQQMAHAGLGQGLGFPELDAAKANSAGFYLPPSDGCRFMRLGVWPEGQARRGSALRHASNIAFEGIQVNDEGGSWYLEAGTGMADPCLRLVQTQGHDSQHLVEGQWLCRF